VAISSIRVEFDDTRSRFRRIRREGQPIRSWFGMVPDSRLKEAGARRRNANAGATLCEEIRA
jgi:hypothetical protein